MIAGKKYTYEESLLGKTEDINRRKQVTNTAFVKLKPLFTCVNTYVSEETKLLIFKALLSSIFLYNCELWSLTGSFENEIDVFKSQILCSQS